jgi:hypothetical protein
LHALKAEHTETEIYVGLLVAVEDSLVSCHLGNWTSPGVNQGHYVAITVFLPRNYSAARVQRSGGSGGYCTAGDGGGNGGTQASYLRQGQRRFAKSL